MTPQYVLRVAVVTVAVATMIAIPLGVIAIVLHFVVKFW